MAVENTSVALKKLPMVMLYNTINNNTKLY